MNCTKYKDELANQMFGAEPVSKQFAEHLAQCAECDEEAKGVRATMALLEEWTAPEPSPYFDQKMAVLLREEQAKAPAGWMERFGQYLQLNTGRQFRPVLAGAFALALVLGGGGFASFSVLHHTEPVQASAAVGDLQILDRNDQAIQQIDQLLQDDDPVDQSGSVQSGS